MYQRIIKVMDMFFKISIPIMVTALASMITIQTILRYIFHRPLLSMEELIVIPSLGLYFLGSIWATRNEAHMNARLLEIFFKSDRSIATIRSISAFGGIIISLWLSYWGWELLKYSMRVKKVSLVLNYRLTIVECLPLVCFSLIAFLMIFEFIKYLKIALGNEMKVEEY